MAVLREADFRCAILGGVNLCNSIIREAVFDKNIKGHIKILSEKGNILTTSDRFTPYEVIKNRMVQLGAKFC